MRVGEATAMALTTLCELRDCTTAEAVRRAIAAAADAEAATGPVIERTDRIAVHLVSLGSKVPPAPPIASVPDSVRETHGALQTWAFADDD